MASVCVAISSEENRTDTYFTPADYFGGNLSLDTNITAQPSPSPVELKSKQNSDEDQYLLMAGSLGSFLEKEAFNTAKSFVMRLLQGKFANLFRRGERWMEGHFPAPLSPKENLIFETMYGIQGFSSRFETIMKEWPDMSSSEALMYSFKFLYRYDPKNPLAVANEYPPIITPEDVSTLMTSRGFQTLQIYNIARLIHEEYGWDQESLWASIYNSILEGQAAVSKTAAKPPMNRSLTDSQELYLKQVAGERASMELEAVKDLFHEMAIAIRAVPTNGKEALKAVQIGQFSVDISPETLGQSIGRFALLQTLERIIDKIEAGTSLDISEENLIGRLKQHNPVVKKIIDARTNQADVAIRGTNLAMSMAERVQLGEELWFAKLLDEVKGCSGPTHLAVVVQNSDGSNTRYEFMMNGPEFVKGERFALYAEGDPYPSPPFSFGMGNGVCLNGDTARLDTPIVVIDDRSRTFTITTDDINRFRALAREANTDPALVKDNRVRAFLKFFNKIQAIGIMIYGESFEIMPGSPEAKIKQYAADLGREIWAAEIRQRLNVLIAEFSDMKGLQERFKASYGAEAGEHVESMLDGEIRAIRNQYINRFSPKARAKFGELTTALRAAIKSGDVAARNAAIDGIRTLTAQTVVTRHADKLSLDLYKEVTTWRKLKSVKELLAKDVPADLREVIVMRSFDPATYPKLDRAREYTAAGSIDRAFLEYDRIVADSGGSIKEKMIAQAEKAELAVKSLQFQRAKRAVDWIKWMEALGREVPSEAKVILEKLPPLNSGARVVVKRAPSKPPTPVKKTAGTKTSIATQDAALQPADANFDPKEFKTPVVRGAIQSYEFLRDVGGPAIFGAMTFLTAKEVVKTVLPEPETHLEAVVYGYDVVATAMLFDGIAQKVSTFLVNATTKAPQVFQAATEMSLKKFAGGMGASVFVYKGVEGAAKAVGASDRVAEVTGLVGTGMVMGGWRAVVGKIFSAETAMRVIAGGEQVIAKGGAVYLITDAAPTIIEAVYNQFDEPVSVRARDEWYAAMKQWHYDRALFGNAEDVPWYNQVGNTLFNVFDNFVPAAFHKSTIYTDDVAVKWLIQCEWKLKNGYPCR